MTAPFRHPRTLETRWLAPLFASLVALLCVFAPAEPGHAQAPTADAAQPSPQPQAVPPQVKLDALKTKLDQVEAASQAEGVTDNTLSDLRASLTPVREDLRALVADLEEKFADLETRLKQLGPAPADGAVEDPTIAAQRAQLTDQVAEADALVKQARLLALRTDQLSSDIVERRRQIFTNRLVGRTSSVLDPYFWLTPARAVPTVLDSLAGLARAWWVYATAASGAGSLTAAGATLLFFVAAAIMLARWWRRRTVTLPSTETRFAKALMALLVLVGAAAAAPLAVIVVGLVLDGFGLLPGYISNLGVGLAVGTAVAAFGRGVGVALFAPGEPGRRLIAIDDDAATRLTTHLTWLARIAGAAVLINVVNRAVDAPLTMTVAVSALSAVLITLVLLHFLLRTRGAEEAARSPALGRLQWIRALLWLLAAAVAISLATGYIAFGSFLAGRLVIGAGILGALVIGLIFVDTLFTEALASDTPAGRRVAATLGLSPRGVDLAGALLSAAARLLLLIAIIVPLLGPWGFNTEDLYGALNTALFGLRIGDITISLSAVFSTVALVIAGVVLTRAVQRWLTSRLLPRTAMEPSLQQSVSAIFGYVAVIAILALALGQLGIDLQRIALIAGALSVGIGFGLQSVVSNFVSGLILLTERPIRVGDWIVVGGEEGYVRRISVRATEVETFDRASVLVPNSEFITGIVKNWTHTNLTGRLSIPVGVSYDSDVDKVREILESCAAEHAQVLKVPAPRALFLSFGDSALDFELRCYLGNIDNILLVKSDLHFAIMRRFREAGIEIPFPQRDIHIRSGTVGGGTDTASGAKE